MPLDRITRVLGEQVADRLPFSHLDWRRACETNKNSSVGLGSSGT